MSPLSARQVRARCLTPAREATVLAAVLLSMLTLLGVTGPAAWGRGRKGEHEAVSTPGEHDFDFVTGRWAVHHRMLVKRLAGSHAWKVFDGVLVSRKILDGFGIVDDNTLDAPSGTYHAATLRAFDQKTGLWSTWWLDGRTPGASLEPSVRGRFLKGVGELFADDSFDGRPIRVRYIYSKITARSFHWEQAYSADGGQSWEVNWTMDFERLR